MIVTEEQARTWWCPMARAYERGFGTLNRDLPRVATAHPDCTCLASACALWRWNDAPPAKPTRLTYWPPTEDVDVLRAGEPSREKALLNSGLLSGAQVVTVPPTAEWVPLAGDGGEAEGGYWEETEESTEARHRNALAKRRGYCGLAPVVQP